MKKITNMKNNEAKKFFLKASSYSNIELPKYFDFQSLIDEIALQIGKKEIPSLLKSKNDVPNNYSNVNYKIFNNKDGKYDWRSLELIHPVLYVELVNRICEASNWETIQKRFKDFSKNKKIECCSIPVESFSKRYDKKVAISNWWNEFEQKSIGLSLDYEYMAITDITNCYPSIYTHSIAWAIHGIDEAKANQNKNGLLGNMIDKRIRYMSYGQTNGIPQGSTLMDFIAEIVLGYADELITNELKKNAITNYHILRYRDDYRIYSNNIKELEKMLKILSEILAKLNFKLSSQKTLFTDDIITDSIKRDKLARIGLQINDNMSLQKQLFLIRKFGIEYPNSGSLNTLLLEFYKDKIENLKKKPNSLDQIVSIIVDIMYRNPRVYSFCIAILSKLFDFYSIKKVERIIAQIQERFKKVPNTDSLNIWLQRLTIVEDRNRKYSSTLLCEKVYQNNTIWNSDWLNITIDESKIINEQVISELTKNVEREEIDIFSTNY